MIIAIDIDGVLTVETEGHDYKNRTPNFSNICKCNKLIEEGNTIILFSARFEQDMSITQLWLKAHSVKYHKIILGKLNYDILIDDKAFNSFEDYGKQRS